MIGITRCRECGSIVKIEEMQIGTVEEYPDRLVISYVHCGKTFYVPYFLQHTIPACKTFETYEALPNPEQVREYRKKTTIHAVEMKDDCWIKTIEGGQVKCRAGDYLAKGAGGELYPIAKEILKTTYEVVE